MDAEGPPLEQLTRRLAETPDDFLDEPRIGKSGRINVAAVVSDLMRQLGEELPADAAAALQGATAERDRNRLGVILIAAWLLADPWFRSGAHAGNAAELLARGMAELSEWVQAPKFVKDPDRREELARTALAGLRLRPAGESIAQAQDRLTTISTAERKRVIAASRAAEERARQIREALTRKAADESADKWSRE